MEGARRGPLAGPPTRARRDVFAILSDFSIWWWLHIVAYSLIKINRFF